VSPDWRNLLQRAHLHLRLSYDKVGNLTVQTRTITSTLVTTYTYDAANRLINAGGVLYTWNANPTLLRYEDFAATWSTTAARHVSTILPTQKRADPLL